MDYVETVISPNVSVLDANSARGPEIRRVAVSIMTWGQTSAIRFKVRRKADATPEQDLFQDPAFVAGLNRAMNEIFAVAELVGKPFRDMVLRADTRSYSNNGNASPVFGYGLSGREGERAGMIILAHIDQIRAAADAYSVAEIGRLKRTVSEPEPGMGL